MKICRLAVVLLCMGGSFLGHANSPLPSDSDSKIASPELAEAQQKQAQKINLNTADVATLTHAFTGIGKKRAEAIVAYREEHGGFKSVLELAQIHGLGLGYVTRYKLQLEAVFSVAA